TGRSQLRRRQSQVSIGRDECEVCQVVIAVLRQPSSELADKTMFDVTHHRHSQTIAFAINGIDYGAKADRVEPIGRAEERGIGGAKQCDAYAVRNVYSVGDIAYRIHVSASRISIQTVTIRIHGEDVSPRRNSCSRRDYKLGCPRIIRGNNGPTSSDSRAVLT